MAAPEVVDDLATRHSCRVIDSHLSTVLEKSAKQICMQVGCCLAACELQPASVWLQPARVCLQAMEKHRSIKDIAAYVKTEFDKQHLEPQAEGAYHCIVGKHFASTCMLACCACCCIPPGSL